MADRLKTGDLREWVRIETAGGTLSDTGGQTSTTPVVLAASVPAAIEPLPIGFQAREGQALGGQQAALTHQIRMRYREDIKPSMRIVELESPNRTFEIVVPPQPDVRKREITMLCSEKVS